MRAGGVPVVALLFVFASLLMQASTAEDIYWEGEEDASNEFLEVKQDDSGLSGHLKRLKRNFFDFNWFSGSSTTTEAAENYESITEELPDEEITEEKDEDLESDGSGQPDRVEPEPKEKTLRVTFVVMEPYQNEYSNRDSVQFQNFSKSLADAVNLLFDSLPGTQRASLVRIQSRISDEFSCKVTLDIVTIGYEDTDRITSILRDHIRSRRMLGSVAVSDADFNAFGIDPGSTPAIDTCAQDELQCYDGRCIEGSKRCNGVQDCPDGSDEAGCPPSEGFWSGQGQERNAVTTTSSSRVTEVTTPTEESEDLITGSGTTTTAEERPNGESVESEGGCYDPINCVASLLTYCPSQKCDGVRDCPHSEDELDCETSTTPTTVCLDDELSCDVTRCVSLTRRCDGVVDCYDKKDEEGCEKESCGVDDFRCNNGRCIESSRRCDRVSDCPDEEDERDCDCLDDEFRCVNDGSCIEGRKRCDGVSHCSDNSDEEDCGAEAPRCPPDSFTCPGSSIMPCAKRCDDIRECDGGEDEDNCDECNHECDGRCLEDRQICNGVQDCSNGSDEQLCDKCDTPNDFRCDNGDCLNAAIRCNGLVECTDGSDELHCNETMIPSPEGCTEIEFRCRDGSCVDIKFVCDGRYDCIDNSDEENCPCNDDEFQCRSGPCIPILSQCNGQIDCDDGSDEVGCSTARPFPTPAPYPYAPVTNRGLLYTTLSTPHLGEPSGNGRYDESRGRPAGEREGLGGFSGERGDRGGPAGDRGGRGDLGSAGESGDPGSAGERGGPGSSGERGGPGSAGERGGPGSAGERGRPGSSGEPGRPGSSGERGGPGSAGEPGYPGGVAGERGGPVALNLKTYPNEQTVRHGGDVVFQCRDEGPQRAPVRWVREGGRSLKPGATDRNGRLEMNKVTSADSGVYICQAPKYLGYPGSELRVTLTVEAAAETFRPPFPGCQPYEATCGNGQCIPKSAVCDGRYDCSDRSDEDSCNQNGMCEPNQYQCANRRCVLKTWLCDSEDDCGDGSDEQNCGSSSPGEPCLPVEFACSNNQCVPKSFHCDGQSDCMDGSDEIGCAPVHVTKPPEPSNLRLNPGDVLTLVCEAVGVPVPLITWRLNWGHVPEKCTSTSVNGVGTLTCPNMQPEDSGAYSCEAINNKGTNFAAPDAIVYVNKTDVCRNGYFNSEARTENECIRCFCFGESTQCRSADLFTYNMPTALGEGGTRLIGVKQSYTGEIQLDAQPVTDQYYYQPLRNGATVTKLENYGSWSSSAHPYLTLPETYNGNQLTSYGGRIKYTLSPHSQRYGYNNNLPDIIIKGKYETLIHQRSRDNSRESYIEVRLTPENWQKISPGGLTPATREEIMMALDNIELILLRADQNDAGVNITDFAMESAQHINVGLGAANLVEECTCPPGYEGLSCEKCAVGYVREKSGPWLGHCRREEKPCPPGTYGDPGSGYGCRPCPCPLTNRENQFARTCSIGPSGGVICDCAPGYVGANCEQCAPGFIGNPLVPGDSCKRQPTDNCNPVGTNQVRLPGECECKDNVQGRYCDQCKEDSFYLSSDFRHGCALCFCSGVAQQCISSNLRRKTTSVRFNVPQIVDQVRVYNSAPAGPAGAIRYNAPIETELKSQLVRGELTLSDFDRSRPTIYYWSLPISFAGDKVTSYGGYLQYLLRHVPTPGGQSSKNNAADIQLISDNHLTFHYFGNFVPANDGTLNASVQFLEKGWQRPDGKEVSREHFLLALADVKTILVKATYTTNTELASLVSASIETAEPNGDGPPALHVEQCICPEGYVGTSCEDCAPGYTRSSSGLYLEHCGRCDCNGHSKMCHPETGICYDCADNTAGNNCEVCKPGFERDIYQNCVPSSGPPPSTCNCDPRGEAEPCDAAGNCRCKQNVMGNSCDLCRPGTFGLDGNNPAGCTSCYCSGVTTECHEANHYTRIPIPAPIFGDSYGGYSLMDLTAQEVINDQFVPAANESELMYIFSYPPRQELFWSLPSFPGNRVLSYGGTLSLSQKYQSDYRYPEEPLRGPDVVLIGDGETLFWNNPNPLRSGETLTYQVPLREENWFVLNSATPASRQSFMSVLKNLKRVLVRATPSLNIQSTAIADVSMDTATETYAAGFPAARGVEVCMCPEGHKGTSCESCAAGYYKDQLGYCRQCNCNGHDCQLGSYDEVICNCRAPYTGPDCSTVAGETTPDVTTRQPPPQTTVIVRITSPTIKIQEVGSSVNFTCQAQSRMTQSSLPVSWNKVDGYLPQGRSQIDASSGMLLITNLQISDSGKYICHTTDGISTAQAIATLRVPGSEMTMPSINLTPVINDYNEGDRIQLECRASGNPAPRITWQRADNRPLPLSFEPYETFFIIERAQVEDSGEYRCIATNAAGSVDRTAIVTVRPKPSWPSRDKLTISPKSSNVVEGQSTRVICTGTTQIPAGTIGWVRQDGTELLSNVRSDNGVLYIDIARLENQGVYVCQTKSSEVSPATVLVTVVPLSTPPPSEVPNISVSVERIKIPTGGSGSVDCNPVGYPLPLIRWKKYEGGFGPGTSQRDNTLIISNAQDDDSGYYLCEGLVDGNPVNNIYVLVEIEKREPPRVEIWPQGEQAVPLGGQFEFHCRVLGGVPEPDVMWNRAGGRPLSTYVQLQPHNVLRFERIEVNDEGEYTCSATNIAGTSSASAVLKVRSPPEITVTPSSFVSAVKGDLVNIECRANGYPEPLVSIKSNIDAREVVPPTSGIAVLRISSVNERDDGDYTCTATSAAGTINEEFAIRVDRGDGGFGEIGGSGEGEFNTEYPNPYDNEPSNMIAIEGKDSRISCNASDEFEVRWGRVDRQPLQYNAVQNGPELIIYNTSKSDAGRYECTLIRRRTGELQQSAYTSLVVMAPPKITLRPPTQTVHPGQSPTVECVVEGDDIIDISWRPVNRPLSRRVETRRSTLIFHQIEIEDAGQYECFAKNAIANASGVAEVVVTEESDRSPSQSHDNEQYAHVGSAVHLSCNVTQPYRVTAITWTKDGGQLPRSVRRKGDNTLFIRLAQKADSGHYVCIIADEYGRRTSNYINLHIEDHKDVECLKRQFRCYDGTECIDEELLCDGFNDCEDFSDEENCVLRDKDLSNTLSDENSIFDGPRDVAPSLVSIDQPHRVFRVGENVEVLCRASSREIRVLWERFGTNQFVETRTYGGGSLLVVPNVEELDAGVYRCTGYDPYKRTSYEDFNLEVTPVFPQPNAPTHVNDDNNVVIYHADLNNVVDLPCNHNLEQPVSIEWKREYSPLPPDVRTNEPNLHLDKVTEADAGTYICRISNSRAAIETRAILKVQGVVPSFEGDGWLALPTLKDAYRQFDIEISFKPTDNKGLILYNSQYEGRSGDYLALQLVDGVPQFILETGTGPVVVRGDRPLQLNTWHTIRLSRTNSKVTMDVDNTGPFITESRGQWEILDLSQPLYIGGVPDYSQLPDTLASATGFVGCVSMLILGREEKNIMMDSIEKYNVRKCDSCSPNLCLNKGICQEARNERGYICHCAAGYAGVNCDRRGEACRPGLCGPGKCTDTVNGYKCACPVAFTGRNCDVQQSIEYPAFTGSAYLAIKAPQASRTLRMSMKVKANAPVTDGIIMYCAESARGHGGFTSLAVHDGKLEFRYDLGDGSGPVVLKSFRPLQPNDWTDVHIARVGAVVSLKINIVDSIEGKLVSPKKDLYLDTPMFVGGVDDSIILNNNTGVSAGFSGCIKDVMVYGGHVDIVNSSIQSANVQECSNYDRGDIPDMDSVCTLCRNGGFCSSPDSTTCTCPRGYNGVYCENRVPAATARGPQNDPCAALPCRNGGTCKPDRATRMNYTCDCPLGYAGANCQMPLELLQSVGFNGNGYLELPAQLLRYERLEEEPAVIALAIHTNGDGVLLYQREVYAAPNAGDYILLRVENGVVVLEWDLGGGVSTLTIENVPVNDGERHEIIAKLFYDKQMSLSVDGSAKTGMTAGFSDLMNADSNVYIGGIPDSINVQGYPGLTGCFEQVELMGSDRGLNLGQVAVTARNTQRCRESRPSY